MSCQKPPKFNHKSYAIRIVRFLWFCKVSNVFLRFCGCSKRIEKSVQNSQPISGSKSRCLTGPNLIPNRNGFHLEICTWCRHSIRKMISASRLIFWDGFQPFFKNIWFSVLPFWLQYSDRLRTKQDTWCRHSNGKWSAHQGASFGMVSSHNWKNTDFRLQYLCSWPSIFQSK